MTYYILPAPSDHQTSLAMTFLADCDPQALANWAERYPEHCPNGQTDGVNALARSLAAYLVDRARVADEEGRDFYSQAGAEQLAEAINHANGDVSFDTLLTLDAGVTP